MKHSFFPLLLLLCFLLLSGCGKEAPAEDVTAKAEVYVENDPILDLCMYSTDTLNPLVTSVKHNAEVLSCLYDSLFTAASDFTAEPDLCEAYRMSEDKTVFSARLRQGVCFQDGTPLTAQDAADSVNRIAASSGYYKSRLPTVAGATAENGELKIYFTEPAENVCILLDFPILPKGGVLEDGGVLAPPAFGSGLFSLAEYRVNKELRLLPNPSHHSGKLPYFPEIIIHMTENRKTALSMLENGTVDILSGDVADMETYTPPEKIRTAAYPGCDYVFLGMDTTENYATITSAIQREKLLPAYAVAASCPVHPESKQPYAAPEYPKAESNRAYTLLFCESTPGRARLAAQIRQDLSAAGITAEEEGVAESEYAARIRSGEYDLFIGEAELLPDFAANSFPANTVGLYFRQEVLLYDEGLSTAKVHTLNPYKSVHQWQPYGM